MPQRRLVLLLCSLLSCLPLCSQPAQRGDLGKRWIAKEWNGPGEMRGYWVRRGNSNEFNAEYVNTRTKKNVYWLVTVLGVEGTTVRFRATLPSSTPPRTELITGRILTDGRTIRGRGAWCKGEQISCGFEVVADWGVAPTIYKQFNRPIPLPAPKSEARTAGQPPAPSGPDAPLPEMKTLPPRWRVRDNSVPGYPYQGTWTIQRRDVRFQYTPIAGGARADGSMQIDKWDGTMIIIRNRGARRVYEGLLQPGGRVLRGTARPCPPNLSCTWEATLEK